jgi:hypothetical protein
MAIASACMPSMRPVARLLSSLRAPLNEGQLHIDLLQLLAQQLHMASPPNARFSELAREAVTKARQSVAFGGVLFCRLPAVQISYKLPCKPPLSMDFPRPEALAKVGRDGLRARRTHTMTSRRNILKFSGVAAATGLAGCATATRINPLIPPVSKVIQDPGQVQPSAAAMGAPPGTAFDPREKPTYVPQTNDPIGFSIADNLFWNDIMMEHAMFFVQLMPGPDLDGPRRQAEEFQRIFKRQLEMSSGIRPDNYVAFNRSTIDQAKRFSEYKKTMREQQATGRMRSLVWPLFFQHTAREADRFAARLDQYNRRSIELDRPEVVDFWSKTMGEHSGFIAHLLDPDERLLIDQATKLEHAFRDQNFRNVRGDDVMKAAHEVLDFKTVGEKGIYAGKIKSIISPPLASHVRREAVKFIDELKRTQAG